jgi:hypothetical protein
MSIWVPSSTDCDDSDSDNNNDPSIQTLIPWENAMKTNKPDATTTLDDASDDAFDAPFEVVDDKKTKPGGPARKPAVKTVLRINALQCTRLVKLINEFKKRERKLFYRNGECVVPADEVDKVGFNCLDQSNPAALRITRVPEDSTQAFAHSFSRPSGRELASTHAEHSALDLFVLACKVIPGFEAASQRRFVEHKMAPRPPKPPVAPIPYDGTEPAFVFESPLMERKQIRPSEMLNALAIGTTGSGKTASFMEPVLFSMLAYRLAGGKSASMLVIDPKVELLTDIQRTLQTQDELDRLVVVGQCHPIHLFQEEDGLSLNERFEKIKGFFTIPDNSQDGNRWQMFAEQLILSFLKDDQVYASVCRLPLLESVAALVTGEASYLQRNQWVALRKLLLLGMEHGDNLRRISDVYDVLTYGVGMVKLERPFARYVAMRDTDQYFYNARGALTLVEGLGSEDIEVCMDLSVRRGLERGNRSDLAALIERGAVVVFQPRQTSTHDLVGRALKSLFFRSVMERADMLRPVGYFCDEFQRFITQDPESGDHTFLDRCRAYRVNCLLASQSMAALLAATQSSAHSRSALDSILVNTPTKVCFRTTDETAVQTMMAFIPRDPRSGQHVLNSRPPSALLTGEYYFALQHIWGRTRYRLPRFKEVGS